LTGGHLPYDRVRINRSRSPPPKGAMVRAADVSEKLGECLYVMMGRRQTLLIGHRLEGDAKTGSEANSK